MKDKWSLFDSEKDDRRINLNLNTAKKIIDKIILKKHSLASSIELIRRKFKDINSLQLFYYEFDHELTDMYNITLMELTEEDLVKFLKLYTEKGESLPKIKLNKCEFDRVKHWIRNVNGHEIIYNVEGFGNPNNTFKELIYLQDEFIFDSASIFGLSVENAMLEVTFLHSIKRELKKILEPKRGVENTLQTETINSDDVIKIKKELHNHIFKGNAIEVWHSMFNEFEVNESSRTDVKFMFEVMKSDELIHNTVNQKAFLEWITLSYDGIIIEKTSNYSKTTTRRNAYARAKELYKR